MLERCIQLVRTSLHQILKFGLPRIAQYITTLFVLSFISSRIWASWRAPSWSSLLPDRREDWVVGDYPSLEHPARQIRLLILFPTTTGAEIEGTLFTASFLELPVYEAVSYAWGDSNKTRTMTLDGKRHYIAENLWAALSAMRTSKLNRTVWVDAICINQSSVEEKSHQVGMMPYIYERATRVLIWLVESPYPDWAADAWRQQWDPVWAQQEADKDWQATAYWLHSLLDQEYWKRCWVVQEIRQARELHVYFGNYEKHGWMPWSTFVELAEQFRRREIVLAKVDRVFQLAHLRRVKYVDIYSLGQLLEKFRDCFCSIQLDRIYAFLGMADDDPGRYFVPDYGRSPFQLYADLVNFYQESEFHQERREIEIMRFAALVRAILSRESSSFPGARRVPKFGVDPASWSYHFCRKFSGSFSRQTIESLSALLDLFSEYLRPDWKHSASEEAIWLPQDPESDKIWLPFFEKGLARPIMARGKFAGHVLKTGPTYGSYLADPSSSNGWIRDAMGTVSSNLTLLRQVVALNKKLATVLGETSNSKVRNFVRFTDRSPGLYQKSRIFLGTDFDGDPIMGIVPSDVPEGAQLIQFWNSDAALVVTRQECEDESLAPKAIIGRAGIVRSGDEVEDVGWDKPGQLDTFLPTSSVSVRVPMSIDTLTKLSFDTVILPGTSGDYWYTSAFSPDHWTFDSYYQQF